MTEKVVRQYGLWESPITARLLSEGRRLDAPQWDSDGGTLVWLEGRSGRGVLVAQGSTPDAPRDLTVDLDVRAEVGYGGGDFTVHGGNVYFVARKLGRIYRQPLAGGPAGPQILTGGRDFYMQPRWSPDGKQLCWIAWDHPNMPWDGSQLVLASVSRAGGGLPRVKASRVIAGGDDVAVFQPEFTPDGRHLLYVSDAGGWGQIIACDLQSGESRPLTAEGVEYGTPAWGQGMRQFAVSHDGRYVTAVAGREGFDSIERIELAGGRNEPVEALAKYTSVAQLAAAPGGDRVVFVGSSSTIPLRIVEHDFSTGRTRVVARSSGETVPQAALARCEAISWSTAGGEQAHGLYYEPAGERFEGIGKPPLIVLIHGGPTSQMKAAWKADTQFFATRGYAVLWVNYRGSTGYGRPYMLKLRGNWGICDVEDAVSGARHLANSGRVDPERMVIMGGSAGGFTVLQTMVRHPEAFRAGICLYGVADQFHLAAETHKFECHYLDSLLGPLPEAAQVYRDRSPVFHARRICRPLAVFQGSVDRAVPREQSDRIVEALKSNGTPHVYHVYEGEGHGWRKAETIEHFYRAVDDFLRRHVLFA